MLKLYFPSLALLVLSSCAVSVSYLGNSFERTSHVDVYVDPSAIKRSYTIVGRGYEEISGYHFNAIEKLQKKVVEKAMQKGADAVLFQDYYHIQPGTSIRTNTRIDTLERAVVAASQTYAGPVVSSGRHILFLKYD